MRFVGPRQLASTPETLYTVPPKSRSVIRNIYANNPSGADAALTLSIGADEDATHIFDEDTVPAGDILFARRDTNYVLEAGEVLQGFIASFPTTAVIDDFTGSNGSIDNRAASGGQTWDAPLFTGHTAASIASNAIVSPGGAGDYSAVISSTTYPADCEVYATFTVLPGGPARLYARISEDYAPPFPDTFGDGNFYELRITAGTSYILSRQMAGVATTIINGTSWAGGNLTAGDKVGFSAIEEATGTRIRVFRTISGVWSEDANVLDTATRPSGAGYLGFELDISTTMDDFGGGAAPSVVLVVDGVEYGL